MKKIWEYIRANNLQNPKDKRKIIVDDVLGTFLTAPVNMMSMNKQLSKHCFSRGRLSCKESLAITATQTLATHVQQLLCKSAILVQTIILGCVNSRRACKKHVAEEHVMQYITLSMHGIARLTCCSGLASWRAHIWVQHQPIIDPQAGCTNVASICRLLAKLGKLWSFSKHVLCVLTCYQPSLGPVVTSVPSVVVCWIDR